MWSKAEEEFLKDNIQLSNETLSSALSRSIDSIKSKKKRLQLSSSIKIGYSNNKLTLIDEPFTKNKKKYGLFICRCGVMKEIRIDSVKSGRTKSCGSCARKNDGLYLVI